MSSSYSDLADFAAVAARLNFRRAAVDRGVSPSALSHSIRGLEERLGVRLLNRTTRSVALTEAGAQLLARLRPAFDDIDAAMESINQFRDSPTGMLRLNAPRAAILPLAPVASLFVQQHPHVRLEIVTDDALIDIVSLGFDAGIRFGEHLAHDMIAVRIGGTQRFAVVGAPDYFARQGKPSTPHDLHRHACIRRRFPSGAIFHWEFEANGAPLDIDVQGPLTLDDTGLMLQCAIAGAGIAFVLEADVEPFLQAGRLVRVLEDWCPPFPGMFLYHSMHRQMPAALRRFIDTAQALQRNDGGRRL
jgi:DNA-binding transcriptional LysR family regulator